MKNILKMGFIMISMFLVACEREVQEKENKPKENIEIRIEEGKTKIKNNVEGYEMKIKGEYTLQEGMEGIRTRISNEEMVIDIYKDNFENTIHSKEAYFSYSNEQTKIDKENNEILNETRGTKNGYDVHELTWKRKELKHLKNGHNYYKSIEIAKNDYEIYTIQIKSKKEVGNEIFNIQDFKIIDKTKIAKEEKYKATKKNWDEETAKYFENTFLKTRPMQWGLFDAEFLDKTENAKKLEQEIQYKFPVKLRYQMIGKDEFPIEEMKVAYSEGRTIQLTMQYSSDGNILYDVLDGKHDDYFIKYARGMKEFGKPILFRLNNEMNGDWVKYSAIYTSKDADIYIQAWQYIYELFEKEGLNNLIWVWNPNHHSKPSFKWNHKLLYYPGDEYVDVIGLTAYNTGDYYEGETWSDFETLYDEIYYQYDKWFEQPFMISEFGSSSVGGDKEQWIREMFEVMPKYERIKIAIWWSWQDFDQAGNPARIYLLDENQEIKEAFREGLGKY